MLTNEDFFGDAKVLLSINATYEARDENGLNPLGQTKGELVLTEKEFVFLEVKGMIRKDKRRLHGLPVTGLVGYSYERWSGGPTTLYLTIEKEDGNRQHYVYRCSKGDYEKFIGKVKERNLI